MAEQPPDNQKRASSSSDNDEPDQKIPSLENFHIGGDSDEEDEDLTPRDAVQETIRDLGVSQLTWETEFVKMFLKFHGTTKSFVFSPSAIYLGCAICYMSSSGHSRNEIRDFLGRGCSSENLYKFFEDLNDRVRCQYDAKIHLGNAMLIAKDVEFDEGLDDELVKVLTSSSTLDSVDFTDLEHAVNDVNDFFIMEAMIEGAVKEEDLRDDMDSVIFNGVSFQAKWLHRLKTSQNGVFTNIEGVSKHHPFLKDLRMVKYSEDDKFRMISIPYADSRFSMNIFLPKTSLTTDIEWLDSEKLRNLLDKTETKLVDIRIPQWKISSGYRLKDFFTETSFSLVFDEGLETLKKLDGSDVRLSQFVHRVVVEVNENGSSPSSITYSPEIGEIDDSESISFIANRPFLFVVTMHRNLLFVGLHVDVSERDDEPTRENPQNIQSSHSGAASSSGVQNKN